MATARSGGPAGCGCRRPSAAARLLAPIPREGNRVVPASRSKLASFSRWLVRLVRTRQLRSLLSAARASATILGALLVSGQVPVDGRYAARAGRLGVAVVPVGSRVNIQHGGGPPSAHERVVPGCVAGKCDGVPDRSHFMAIRSSSLSRRYGWRSARASAVPGSA